MESLYKEIAEKWVAKADAKLQEQQEAAGYWFNSKFRSSFSVDMTFSSISGKNSKVTADVVSMDSDLPLKKRESIDSFTGEIPKLGMKKYLGERQLKELQVLQATGKPEGLLAAKIFDDYKACTTGVFEKLEYMTAQAASTGVISVGEDTNTGRAIRVDFGVPAANKAGVAAVWSDADNATPITDIETVQASADAEGVALNHIVMDRATFNNFKKAQEVKDYYASYSGRTAVSPNLDAANEFLIADFGLSITIYERTFQVEKDGNVSNVKGWATGQVSFFASLDNLGDLVWSDLAEKAAPVEGKVYSYPAEYLMLTKYREGSPLREFTESQGLVLPVINNVDQIYLLDTTAVEA